MMNSTKSGDHSIKPPLES